MAADKNANISIFPEKVNKCKIQYYQGLPKNYLEPIAWNIYSYKLLIF